jgi:hypothetical protein
MYFLHLKQYEYEKKVRRPKGTWTIEELKEAIKAIKVRKCYVQGASRSRNIPLNSLCDHLNGQTCNKKMGPWGVFIDGEDVVMVKSWPCKK